MIYVKCKYVLENFYKLLIYKKTDDIMVGVNGKHKWNYNSTKNKERSCFMKRKSEQEIMVANIPEDIFTMDLKVIEDEKEAYLEEFRPKEYRKIKDFMITKKVLLLYSQAIARLEDGTNKEDYKEVCIKSTKGKQFKIHYMNHSSFRLGEMYITKEYVIYIVKKEFKKYYENYVQKTKHYSKPDRTIWNMVQYMVPNVEKNFECVDGNFAIFIKKPCEMYSLREILEYFEGGLKPEYVASILTRLYYFTCYMGLVEMNHNALMVDNLFFTPGREVEEGESYTIEDMRIVGVFGGWFFTTYLEEKLQGVPKEIYAIMPEECKNRGYSSFEVDELAIRTLAKELLGTEIKNTPEPFLDWVNNKKIARDAYEEFCNWKKVIISSFGAHRFVNMDVSI